MAKFIYRKSLALTESDIRFAMAHTNSGKQCAAFIGCNYNAYKKYAMMYFDSKTGLSLHDLHKLQRKGVKTGKNGRAKVDRVSMIDVLEGKHPDFPATSLKGKLLHEGLMLEECEYCGFNERRVTDGSVPLLLVWKDGDFTNHKRDNLELTCYNHYFLMYDDVFEKAETIDKKCKGYYGDN